MQLLQRLQPSRRRASHAAVVTSRLTHVQGVTKNDLAKVVICHYVQRCGITRLWK